MDKNNQIAEMAKDLRKSEFWYFDDTDCDFELERKKTAENLYNAGYRKASDVAREIFEEIENLFLKDNFRLICNRSDFAELKKKYTENKGE